MKRKSYVLKVSLVDIEPEIWRRFVVPADIALDRLHDVIQPELIVIMNRGI